MSDLTVRPVTAADHAVWLPLWQAYLTFYNSRVADDVTATTWQRFLEPSEPMHAALAWRNGEAVGLVHWIFHRSCWTSSDYCYLQDLFVAPQVRQGGIGSALIKHVYAAAQAAGANRVHWLTQHDNHTARRLYDHIASHTGFVQYRHLLS
ncbi:GNAT family N-acetyltransferase [Atopomonas sediminilitoris]|uniref:GNAT family N-acetyltransferase n=1 Tax=Atopomonas sediminilitoris TaxID=2919919 RepID=UPI001F4E7850|nr:GNAT family N-acetyltransferase [Atopomonas sediminilitoris]MCJ8168169.1 GNAT family N-acetyltransferase [Atopomonas sediminilitoris]